MNELQPDPPFVRNTDMIVYDEIFEAAPELLGMDEEILDEVLNERSFEMFVRLLTRQAIAKRTGSIHPTASRNGQIKVINLTPHEITLYDRRGSCVIGTIPKSDQVARVNTRAYVEFPVSLELEDGSVVEDVLLFYREDDTLLDLPDVEPGTYYVVSKIVQSAHPERPDLITVNSGNDRYGSIKDENGKTIGTKSLQPPTLDIFREIL